MASQTGTLKFRQSDGTYIDLYPKTTIAQVDGLQGQLDSINASLQKKVDLNIADWDRHNYTSALRILPKTGDYSFWWEYPQFSIRHNDL